MNKPTVGIFGATGAVGQEMIQVLYDRNFPLKEIKLFASERSAGKILETPYGKIKLENADNADYSQLNIALFAISGAWSGKNAKKATDAGCVVIDNSSHFRYDDNVPLVIPEINTSAIKDAKLIANPNCTTAIAAIPLWVIHQNFGLKKVIVSTYQASSGAGAAGMDELATGAQQALNEEDVEYDIFAHPLPFNVIPHIDDFQKNGYTKEEMKVTWETQKIFDNKDIAVSCTAVRIPTFRAHAESIVVETEQEIDPQKVKELFKDVPGVTLKDNLDKNEYPMPISATGEYNVEVGRIRQNLIFGKHGLEFFVCGDQLLKGAALNAVQIAEEFVQ